MDPNHQEETNQKLGIELASLQNQVNRDILTIHAKMDYTQDQLGTQITEGYYALNEFIQKFQDPSSSNPPLSTEGVDSNQPLHSHSNSPPRDPFIKIFGRG
jgi:hypothetical protein